MKKKIFCVYCGTKNNINNKTCDNCLKKLDPKENQIIDYLKDHIKDDLKDKTKDGIFNILINFIRSHLYGFVLTLSIILSSSMIISSNLDNNNYKVVENKPVEVNSYLGSGLNSSELTLKYFELLKDNKKNLAAKLFENKDLYNSTNHIFDNISFFTNYYDPSKLEITRVIPNVIYIDGYEVSSVLTSYTYCKENICGEDTNNINFVFIVECVNIDGNWYIFNEQIDFDVDAIYDYKMDKLIELKVDLLAFIDEIYQ